MDQTKYSTRGGQTYRGMHTSWRPVPGAEAALQVPADRHWLGLGSRLAGPRAATGKRYQCQVLWTGSWLIMLVLVTSRHPLPVDNRPAPVLHPLCTRCHQPDAAPPLTPFCPFHVPTLSTQHPDHQLLLSSPWSHTQPEVGCNNYPADPPLLHPFFPIPLSSHHMD